MVVHERVRQPLSAQSRVSLSLVKYVALSLVALTAVLYWMLSDGTDARAPRASGEQTERHAVAGSTTPVASAGDAESPSAESDADDDDTEFVETARWRITYLGPGGVPLMGVPVRVINAWGAGRTDEAGIITFDIHATHKQLHIFDALTRSGRRIKERDTTIRLDGLLPLEVEFRAADTGARIPAANAHLISQAGKVELRNDRMDYSPLEVGGLNRVQLGFDPPAGYTTVTGAVAEFWAGIAPRTRRVDATITLWPELELTVIARDIDENPIEGATIKEVFLCGQFDERMTHEVHVRAPPTDNQGRTRVRGVPFLPGIPLTVLVDGGDSESPGFDQIQMAERKVSMTIDCTVDPSLMPGRSNSAIGIGGGRTPKLAEWGTAVIEARFRDGTPAANASYRIGSEYPRKLDELGRASIGERKPGRYEVWLSEPGRVPTRTAFEIKVNETTQVLLREDAGWSLRVRTVDADGNALPYRPLRVSLNESSMSYYLVVGGVQSIPIQTGADGTVVLPNLGEESMTVAVRIAGRTLAEAKLPYDPSRREIVITIP